MLCHQWCLIRRIILCRNSIFLITFSKIASRVEIRALLTDCEITPKCKFARKSHGPSDKTTLRSSGRITGNNGNSNVTHIFPAGEIGADCENWRTNCVERFSRTYARVYVFVCVFFFSRDAHKSSRHPNIFEILRTHALACSDRIFATRRDGDTL